MRPDATTEIDDELRQLAERRTEHRDNLIRALIGMDACDQRTEVLLERRTEAGR